MKERIILALDVSSRREALNLVQPFRDRKGMVKVGLQLFTAEGPAIVREIIDQGVNVFLDLKFHDIPNTVRNAAIEAAKLGVSMMTIHTAGGRAMMQSVSKALVDGFGEKRPITLGITVLTSLDDGALREIGVDAPTNDQVLRMARLAESSGFGGVVCSPREIRIIRDVVQPNFRIVTPGIRMPGQSADDQERTATPREAIAAGADYIVVGRSIMNAPDPRAALEELIQSV